MSYLTKEPIDISALMASAPDTESGAENIFIGRIRRTAQGEPVTGMEYEAQEILADKIIGEIISETKSRWPVREICLQHRIGFVKAGDISIFISVKSSHRDEAFQACRFLIDQIKKRVPIWKKEYYQNTSKWLEINPLNPS
jgi:molybdopterin synthase catalytic subunit